MVDQQVLGEIDGHDVPGVTLLPDPRLFRLQGVDLAGSDGVPEEDPSIVLGDDGPDTGGAEGDRGVLAGGAATEVGASDDDRKASALSARGDLETGGHHTVEDVGICLGEALHAALGDRRGIVRYGQATIPMDEARASCAIDISGRPLCAFTASLPRGAIGDFDYELTEEFFRALATNARLTLHLEIETGTNVHHMIEAAFKAAARALRAAVAIDPTETGVPSTKGRLT